MERKDLVSGGRRHNSVPQRGNIEELTNVNRKLRLKQYSSLLCDCAFRETFNEGMTIHGIQIKMRWTRIFIFNEDNGDEDIALLSDEKQKDKAKKKKVIWPRRPE